MDIAKIRKKIKRSLEDGRQAKSGMGAAPAREDPEVPSEDRIPEPPAGDEVSEGPMEEGQEAQRKAEPEIVEAIQGGKEEPSPPEGLKGAEGEKAEVLEILTFSLEREEFAFRVSQLEEILRYQQITTVPNSPDFVLGITSLRGKVIPVVDLKLKLSLTRGSADRDFRGKILIVKGPKGPIGVAVDKVTGVVRIPASEILPPPSHLSERELRFVDGIAVVDKRFVSIINMEETVSLSSK